MPTGNQQAGFSYLLLLAWLSILSLMLLRSNDHQQAKWRQEREAQLLFAGDQIRKALLDYRDSAAGNKCSAKNFNQLVSDRRGTKVQYHLRLPFRDPFSQKTDWGMLYDDQQRWIGVYSQASGRPLKQEGFSKENENFKQAASYAKWQFKVELLADAPLPERCP